MRTTPIPKHGTEIFRLETKRMNSELAQWTQLVRSLKSSGAVMEQRVCLSNPNKNNPEGKLFKWSWKNIARLKPSEFPSYVEKLIAEGWVLIHGQRKLSRNRKDAKRCA